MNIFRTHESPSDKGENQGMNSWILYVRYVTFRIEYARFLEKWGFLYPVKTTLNDYGNKAFEITEEQNYNMIDGRMNNLPPKPRKIGKRISVLDRLHLKQAEIAKRDKESVPQVAAEEERERRRK